MSYQVDLVFWSIFDRFLMSTCTLRTQFGTSGLAISWFFRFSANIDFGSNFSVNSTFIFPPQIHQNRSKTRLWKRSFCLTDFRIDFFSDFGGLWDASWEGKSIQDRSKNDHKMYRKCDKKKKRFASLTVLRRDLGHALRRARFPRPAPPGQRHN